MIVVISVVIIFAIVFWCMPFILKDEEQNKKSNIPQTNKSIQPQNSSNNKVEPVKHHISLVCKERLIKSVSEVLSTYNKIKDNADIIVLLNGYTTNNQDITVFKYIEFLVAIPDSYRLLEFLEISDLQEIINVGKFDYDPVFYLFNILKQKTIVDSVKYIENYKNNTDYQGNKVYLNYKELINYIKPTYNKFNNLFLDALIENGYIEDSFEDKFAVLCLLLKLLKVSKHKYFVDEVINKYDLEEKQSFEYYINNILDYEEDLNKSLMCSLYNEYNNIETKSFNLTFLSFKTGYSTISRCEQKSRKKHYLENLKKSAQNSNIKSTTLADIDLMSGREFEIFIAELFRKMGYETKVTPESNDQGIDVIATKRETSIAIQAKCYSGVVGNHAIMEAVAGKNYYNADKCMVITNSTFTKSAKELAQKNNVTLWDRKILEEKLVEVEE